MSGQLVIAELEAFRAVLVKAKGGEGEAIKSWCRSTIANALHRVGPTDGMKAAAERAWSRADQFAAALSTPTLIPTRRDALQAQAVDALDELIGTVKATKALLSCGLTRDS